MKERKADKSCSDFLTFHVIRYLPSGHSIQQKENYLRLWQMFGFLSVDLSGRTLTQSQLTHSSFSLL